jgi:hypothetical protein
MSDAEHDKLQQQIDGLQRWSNGKDSLQIDMINDLKAEIKAVRTSHEVEANDLRREIGSLSKNVLEAVAQSRAWYDLVNKDLNNMGEKVRENKADIKCLKERPGKWIDRGIAASIAAGVSAVMAWLFGNLFSMK